MGANGRCTERGFLEFHHVVPYAAGGTAAIDNIELRCRAHNVYESDTYFGTRAPLLRERPCAYVPTKLGPALLCQILLVRGGKWGREGNRERA